MNADDLQQHETLGHKMAMSGLELGIADLYVRDTIFDYARNFMHTIVFHEAYAASETWRDRAKGAHGEDWAKFCATMAGCELAIEEWEAANVDA